MITNDDKSNDSKNKIQTIRITINSNTTNENDNHKRALEQMMIIISKNAAARVAATVVVDMIGLVVMPIIDGGEHAHPQSPQAKYTCIYMCIYIYTHDSSKFTCTRNFLHFRHSGEGLGWSSLV